MEPYLVKAPPDQGKGGEFWKEIPTAPGYYVSNHGRVRRHHPERWVDLTTANKSQGGRGFLRAYVDGKEKGLQVARLVLSLFGRPPKPGELCRHLNDDPSDDRIENLAWGTHRDNMRDMVRNGGSLKGVKHHKSKLSEDDVKEIRSLAARGVPRIDISKKFNVTLGTIGHVVRRMTWRHI
jgi:hypothetical protein